MNNGNDLNLPDVRRLGIVVSGSLADGVEVRLDPEMSVEDIKVGTPLKVVFLPRGGGGNRKTDLAFRPCT